MALTRHLLLFSAAGGLLFAAERQAVALPVSRPPAANVAGDSTIALLGYHTKAPAGWSVRPPASSSRLAQFVVRGSDASSDAEVVVFFFGASQGGNVEANLTRWRSQFSTPDGSAVPETVTHDSSGAFPVTTAEFRGTYRRGIGAGSADSVRTGQTLVAAIVETPRGTLFVQMFGPSATVAAHRAEYAKFVKELK
jgi:hypothetical protein